MAPIHYLQDVDVILEVRDARAPFTSAQFLGVRMLYELYGVYRIYRDVEGRFWILLRQLWAASGMGLQ